MNNPLFDYLDSLLDDAERRMDATGIPTVVRERCPYCDATGVRCEARCTACAGRGYINAEAQ